MANIITDKERLQEELRQKQKELGLRGMENLKNKDELSQLKDLEKEKNHIAELMKEAEEKRKKAKTEEAKAKRLSFKESAKRYLKIQEERAKESFNKRRISL